MLIQGDPRSKRFEVEALIENECQFTITYKNKCKVAVTFIAGVWEVRRENGDYIQVTDKCEIPNTNNNLLKGFIDGRFAVYRKWKDLDRKRKMPTLAITDLLHYWADDSANIEQIDVTQAERL